QQVFELKTIHADPNPANFAFRRDGTVVLYDFGCIKRLDPSIVDAYADTVAAGLVEDYAGVEAGLVRLGARNPDGPPVSPEYYKMWRDIFARPFVCDGPFDYGRATLHREALEHVPGFLA